MGKGGYINGSLMSSQLYSLCCLLFHNVSIATIGVDVVTPEGSQPADL